MQTVTDYIYALKTTPTPRPEQRCPVCHEIVVTQEDKTWHRIIHRWGAPAY